jgi:polysaccharide transporter, PST family
MTRCASLSSRQVMAFPLLHALRERYSESAKLRRIVGNIGWLFIDRVLRMGVGLFVGIWVARYLGPAKYGLLNYATAFASLFGTIALLGIDSVLVREIATSPERRDAFLGSAFCLKLTSSVLVFPCAVYAISLARHGDSQILQLVSLCSLGFVVQSTNVIVCYFQSQVSSKYAVYATNAAFLLAALLRVVLILLGRSVIAFGYAALMELVLGSIFLTLAYRHNRLTVRNWFLERRAALRLLRDGWPLILSSVAVSFYMRIDQVMLGQMLGDQKVGIYSAAVRVSEIWYFVPMAIVATLFPVIVESKRYGESVYQKRVSRLFSLMAWSGIVLATAFTFLSSWVIHFLYGPAFSDAQSVLRIHIWASVPVALGVAYGAVLTAENAQVVTLYASLIGAGVNVLLNWTLIPRQGPQGAAIATLASYCMVVLSTLFFRRSRRTGIAILRSFVFR